jgi:isopropylmalate/homocitrate/citramalate synthase
MAESGTALSYDWNTEGGPRPAQVPAVTFDDETLRDGLQSPSVAHPTVAERLQFLELAAAVGVTAADVGLPGAGARAAREAEAVCHGLFAARLPIVPNCAARARREDLEPIVDIAQRIGHPVEAAIFLGSSPLRCRVEGWSLGDLLARTEESVAFAVAHGAPVTFVAEDTTRSHPEDLRRLFLTAIRAGATRLCLADTAGQADPFGAVRLVRFARGVLPDAGATGVGLDWHGHNDRGLAVANALAAAWAGAGRLHATALGVGERLGNAAMEQLLVNARLLGWAQPNLRGLMAYVRHASAMVGVAIPPSAPVAGRDAFRTSTGVHASAILKAGRQGDDELVDLVYSAIPAAWLGRQQEIEVGPMSGAANVRWWLAAHGYADDARAVATVLATAKVADRILDDDEIRVLVEAAIGSPTR